MNKEYENRGEDVVKMTREEKKELLRSMLANAGVEEKDIQTEMVDKLSTKELNDYYKKYEAAINKYKTKKI